MRFAALALALLAACSAPQSPSGSAPPAAASAPAPASAVAPPAPAAPPSAPPAAPPRLVGRPIPLPGATGPVSLDYLAADRAAGRVWIPAGNTGSVDVLDTATGKLTRIADFPTRERDVRGQKRVMGPSSVTIGEGVVYIGNRADSQVCVVDAARLARGACVALASPPDGLQYVSATREVWVTTPRDKSITVLDASAPRQPKVKARIALPGQPEGYAVDAARGVFYTNLEDQDRTVALDVRARRVTATWGARCGADGPRGLALDAARGFLLVACTDRVNVLDVGHGGALRSTVETGGGVDNIDYLESRRQVYAAAGQAARLTVAALDGGGTLRVVATAATAPGTRVVVVAADGTAYVADPRGGRLLAFAPAP